MVGIESYGVYVPFHRLSRSEISQTWGGTSGRGEKTVANYDEDSITMAVAAGMKCVRDFDPQSIDALFFASTTFPYKEKQSAAVIAAAIGLRRNVFTSDFSGSLRSGTSAFKSAVDAINASSAKKAMVCVSDMRTGYPNGSHEKDFGDGSAAFVLGNENVLATIEGSHHITNEINDVWRSDKDTFVQSWEERFVREKGYLEVSVEAISETFKKYNVGAKDFAKLVAYAPNPKLLSAVARKLGFEQTGQVQDSLYDLMGNTGAALGPMLLCAALEKAVEKEKILFAAYGDGADVFLIEVKKTISDVKAKEDFQAQLSAKRMTSYQSYLRWREILPVQPAARPPLERPSAVALWRDSRSGLGLYGMKCRACGAIQYPAQRVCIKCHEKDQFDMYRFADKRGKLTTFSHDNLAASTDPPVTVAVVDFDEGGRIMCDMTDKNPEQVEVGMPVEMTFRKVRYAGDIYDYWWKCTPIRT